MDSQALKTWNGHRGLAGNRNNNPHRVKAPVPIASRLFARKGRRSTMQKHKNTNYLALAAALAAATTANLQAAPFTYRLVASLGQTAPGGAQYLDYFEVGQINNLGDVIFGAEVGSNGGATDLGEGTFLTHFGRLV